MNTQQRRDLARARALITDARTGLLPLLNAIIDCENSEDLGRLSAKTSALRSRANDLLEAVNLLELATKATTVSQ